MNNTSILERSFWIFDLDGTLTVPKHDFEYIRKRLNVPAGQDILGYLSSLTESQRMPLDEWLYDHELEIAKDTEPAEGSKMLIKSLSARGCTLGVVTRNLKSLAQVSLDVIGIGGCFKETDIIGRDEAPPKPEPDGLRHLLKSWDVEPDDAVMVGDYLYDLEAGRNAGTGTIHVDPTGLFSWPECTDLAVRDLAVLHGMITGQ